MPRGTRRTDGKALEARHYLGTTKDLPARLALHRAGQGARMLAAAVARGIDFTLVRTWEGGRDVELRLKRRKEGTRLCPNCRGRGGVPALAVAA
jgi:hypothetical protein